jgi:hypothetical protein
MRETTVWTETDGTETSAICSDCGRLTFDGAGILTSEEGDLADYFYSWTEGHERRFMLAISPCARDGSPIGAVAVVAANVDEENVVYTVLEPSESPWDGNIVLGPILGRQQILVDNLIPEIFALVDAIVANERRLSSRILTVQNT